MKRGDDPGTGSRRARLKGGRSGTSGGSEQRIQSLEGWIEKLERDNTRLRAQLQAGVEAQQRSRVVQALRGSNPTLVKDLQLRLRQTSEDNDRLQAQVSALEITLEAKEEQLLEQSARILELQSRVFDLQEEMQEMVARPHLRQKSPRSSSPLSSETGSGDKSAPHGLMSVAAEHTGLLEKGSKYGLPVAWVWSCCLQTGPLARGCSASEKPAGEPEKPVLLAMTSRSHRNTARSAPVNGGSEDLRKVLQAAASATAKAGRFRSRMSDAQLRKYASEAALPSNKPSPSRRANAFHTYSRVPALKSATVPQSSPVTTRGVLAWPTAR